MAYKYIVAYSTAYNGPWTTYGSPVTNTSDVISGLTGGTPYYFEITPVDTTTNVSGVPVIIGPVTTASQQTTVMRNYWDQPGTNNSVWNTPFGDGAIWSLATDQDTIDLRHGGIINGPSWYGDTCWVSQSATDQTATWTGGDGNYTYQNSGGVTWSVTVHMVKGSYSAGPYPAVADQPYGFMDVTGHPGLCFFASPVEIDNFGADSTQNNTGPYNTYYLTCQNGMSDAFGEPYALFNMQIPQTNGVETAGVDVGISGFIRGYDLDPSRNPARIPGTNLTAVQHMLQWATDAQYLKSNPITDTNINPSYPNGYQQSIAGANSWPQLYCDFQSGGNVYTGHIIAGSTIGIPMSTAMPSGLSSAGQQLWWTLQHYGAIWANQAGGGVHFCADQDACAWNNGQWLSNANTDLPKIVQYLCILRNQHIASQSLTASPKNGPGNRVDSGPPPLRPLS